MRTQRIREPDKGQDRLRYVVRAGGRSQCRGQRHLAYLSTAALERFEFDDEQEYVVDATLLSSFEIVERYWLGLKVAPVGRSECVGGASLL